MRGGKTVRKRKKINRGEEAEDGSRVKRRALRKGREEDGKEGEM